MREDFGDDTVLVAALRRGDQDAFGYLLDTYTSALVRVARAYVATASTAEDVVQETWAAVITGIDRFEQRASVKTWICRILVNVARSRGVKEHRSVPFASLGRELDADEPVIDPSRFRGARDQWPGHWAAPPVPWDEDPEHRLLATETVAVVDQAVGRLPSAQRSVVTLRDIEGWSAREVCDALDISEVNQRVLLHRARSKVRRALELHFEDTA